MAHSKIDIFFQLSGLDCHIELTPGEGESGIALLQSAVKALKGAGAEARPVPGRGGPRKPAEPPLTACPVCEAAITPKNWTNKEGKAFVIHACPRDQNHYKKFVPAA